MRAIMSDRFFHHKEDTRGNRTREHFLSAERKLYRAVLELAVLLGVWTLFPVHLEAAGQTQEGSGIQDSFQVETTTYYGTVAQIDVARQAAAKAAAEAAEEERIRLGLTPVVIRVRQDGTGDAQTIQAAVDTAHNGDILMIGPGVYHEHVNNRYKFLALIGETGDPADVVIESGGRDYFSTPLDMCTGVLRNITVHATTEGEETVQGLYSYALHSDFEAEQGSTFLVDNCVFTSELNTAAGLGLKLDYSADFRNCTFENRSTGPALFLHNYECLHPYTQAGTQKITFDGCRFISQQTGSPVIVMMSEELCEGAAEITFRNNTVTSAGDDAPVSMSFFDDTDPQRQLAKNHFLGSSDWILTPDSSGNNVAALNYGS